MSLTLDNPVYMKNLQKRLQSGQLNPAVETFILAHAVGKPKETLVIEDAPALLVVDELTPDDIADLKVERDG